MSRSDFITTLITISGLVFRVAELNNPVTYDEAYTYVGFTSHGL